MDVSCLHIYICIYTKIYAYIYTYIYMLYICMLPLFVALKKVYDRNAVNKYRIYLLLDVIIFNLIDYVYVLVR